MPGQFPTLGCPLTVMSPLISPMVLRPATQSISVVLPTQEWCSRELGFEPGMCRNTEEVESFRGSAQQRSPSAWSCLRRNCAFNETADSQCLMPQVRPYAQLMCASSQISNCVGAVCVCVSCGFTGACGAADCAARLQAGVPHSKDTRSTKAAHQVYTLSLTCSGAPHEGSELARLGLSL